MTHSAGEQPGTSFCIRGSAAAANALAQAYPLEAAADVDWIIVQMHQDALSSSNTGNGSDAGLGQDWLPLFDRDSADVVVR